MCPPLLPTQLAVNCYLSIVDSACYNKAMKSAILKPIFWDLDVEKLDIKKNSRQIIERILEYGDSAQVNWMFKHYKKEEIKEVLKNSRQLSRKSANFWAFYFNIPKNEVRCLTRSFLAIRKSIWPY